MADFTTVTEISGDEVSTEQIERMAHRYIWAADYCRDKDVAEVACGSGQGLARLKAVSRTLYAGDIMPALVTQAKAHYGDTVQILQMDAHALPFPRHSLDVVLLFEAIYYLKDPAQFIKECRRVLRPHGVVLIATANKDLYDFNPSPYSYSYFGVVELQQLFSSAGFACCFFGNVPVEKISVRQRMFRPIKAAAVRLHLIPKTMAGKKLFKRLMFGKLKPMPPEINGTWLESYKPPQTLDSRVPNHTYKTIYLAAVLNH